MKSLSDKWEKLRSTYLKMKKLKNQTSGSARDDGAKFIWYDQTDEILSFMAKAIGVPGGMDQVVPIPGTGTSNAPIDVNHEDDKDSKPSSTQSPTRSGPTSSTGTRPVSTGSSPRIRAIKLAGVRGKGISSQPAKKPRIERNLMDAIDRMIESTTEIEKLRIEATMAMYKDNLVERQEQRKLEHERDRLQQESSEHMAVVFADAIKKTAK